MNKLNAIAKGHTIHLFVSELAMGSQEMISQRAATGPVDSRAVSVHMWQMTYCGTVIYV